MADTTVADVAAEDAAEREQLRAGMTIADLDERRRDLEDSIAAQTVERNELVAEMRKRMHPLRARKV